MKTRMIVTFVVGVALFIMWSGGSEKEMVAAGEVALAEAIELVSRIEPYAENQEYIDGIMREAHEQAFSLSYSKGIPGVRYQEATKAEFRQDKYYMWMFHYAMRKAAHDSNDTGIRKRIRRLQGIQAALKTLRDEEGIKKIGF